MAESREILRLLQGYGKVEMFKNLKYDALPTPNTMLAIFESEEAAQKLLRRSPLRFNMSRDEPDDGDDPAEQSNQSLAARAETTESTSSDRMALAESAARNEFNQARASPLSSAVSVTREYQLQVNIATMHHRDHINASSYHGPFAVDRKSAVQEDLAKRVPLVGLSEINLKKSEKPWRVLAWERERDRKERKSLRQMLSEAAVQTGPEGEPA